MNIQFEGRDWPHVLQQMQSFMMGLSTLSLPPAPANEARTEGGDNRRRFKVLTSPYGDINPGDVGIMMDEKLDGYALMFDKDFASAANLNDRTKQTRTFFFSSHQVEEIK